MSTILIIIIFVIIIMLIIINKPSKSYPSQELEEQAQIHTEEKFTRKEELSIKGAYKKSWMFSYHEKDAYFRLKPIADELGYIVFAKVRLLDLLEPIKGSHKYKTYFYKIQAKHVDFVLCDQKLVARYIIELDDNSHNTPERQERDKFVNEVTESVGYKIIHTKSINDTLKQQIKPSF